MNVDVEEFLESVIDTNGMSFLLEKIEVICQKKAEHICANWQDVVLAKKWERAAGLIVTANANIIDLKISK